MKTIEQIEQEIKESEIKILLSESSNNSVYEKHIVSILNRACIDTLKWVIEDE